MSVLNLARFLSWALLVLHCDWRNRLPCGSTSIIISVLHRSIGIFPLLSYS